MTKYLIKDAVSSGIKAQFTPLAIGLVIAVGILIPSMYYWGKYNGYNEGYDQGLIEGELSIPQTKINIIVPEDVSDDSLEVSMMLYILEIPAEEIWENDSLISEYMLEMVMFRFNETHTKILPYDANYSFAIVGVEWEFNGGSAGSGDYEMRYSPFLFQPCGFNYTFELIDQLYDEGENPFFYSEYFNSSELIQRDNTFYEYRFSDSCKLHWIESSTEEVIDVELVDIDLWNGDFDGSAPFLGLNADSLNEILGYLVFGFNKTEDDTYFVFSSSNQYTIEIDLNLNYLVLITTIIYDWDDLEATVNVLFGDTNYSYQMDLIV